MKIKDSGALKKDMYKLIQLYARLRDVDSSGYGLCASCNKRVYYKEADGGHFIARRHMATAFDPRNVHLQCKQCNSFPDGDVHVSFAEYIDKKLGEGTAAELRALKKTIRKYPIGEIRDLLKVYTEKVRALREQKYL